MPVDKLYTKIETLASTLERMRLDEYLDFVKNRKRMLWLALLGGVMRGIGFMFGFSVIGALLITILRGIVIENIPGISGFLAEVLYEIDLRLR